MNFSIILFQIISFNFPLFLLITELNIVQLIGFVDILTRPYDTNILYFFPQFSYVLNLQISP